MTRRPIALSSLALAALAGCGEPDVNLPESTTTFEASVATRELDSAVVTAECDQAPDGTACGDGGAVTHCLYNACVLNVCGDGVKAGVEVCDDGDQEDADGCNSRCQEPACGNGLVDAREQCDDGNTSDGDDCDSKCRDTSRNGGGLGGGSAGADAGVATDAGPSATDSGSAPTDAGASMMDSSAAPMDSGTVVTDTGVGVVDSGAVDSGPVDSGPPVDAAACQECVRAPTSPCRDWLGSGDFVAGCFNNADPLIVERCVALYRCVLRAPDGCAADATRVVRCYCGTLNIDNGACFNPANTPNGPCVAEVYAASGCTTQGCIETDLVAEGKASYYAQFLTMCTLDPEGCGPSCPVPQTANF